MEKKMKILHVTHDDADAVAADVVVRVWADTIFLYNKVAEEESRNFNTYDDFKNTYEVKTLFCKIGTQDEQLLSEIRKEHEESDLCKYLFITDLSLKEETCQELDQLSEKHNIYLRGYDHHKTNQLNEKFSWFKVSLNYSAAKFIYLMELLQQLNMVIPERGTGRLAVFSEFIDDISFVDNGEFFQKEHSDEEVIYEGWMFVPFLCSEIGLEETRNYLYEFYSSRFDEYIIDNIQAAQTRQKTFHLCEFLHRLYMRSENSKRKFIEETEKRSRLSNFRSGDKVYRIIQFIGGSKFDNSVSTYLYQKYDQIDFIMVLYPTTESVSLRSNANTRNTDVSVIAKSYGGGGHRNASGFPCTDDQFLELISNFYMSRNLMEDIIF